jgi:hypothetical protein
MMIPKLQNGPKRRTEIPRKKENAMTLTLILILTLIVDAEKKDMAMLMKMLCHNGLLCAMSARNGHTLHVQEV